MAKITYYYSTRTFVKGEVVAMTARAALLVVIALVVEGCGRKENQAPTRPMTATPMIAPGITRPRLHRASEVQLPDDTPVIGVVVQSRARAYTVKGLSGMLHHVVDDLI